MPVPGVGVESRPGIVIVVLDEFAKGGDLATDWGKSPEAVREEAERFIADHEDRGREVFERFTILATNG